MKRASSADPFFHLATCRKRCNPRDTLLPLCVRRLRARQIKAGMVVNLALQQALQQCCVEFSFPQRVQHPARLPAEPLIRRRLAKGLYVGGVLAAMQRSSATKLSC